MREPGQQRVRIPVLWLFSLAGSLLSGFGQDSNLPKLAEIKMAAEQGDAEAQARLAEAYQARLDTASAISWYYKSAEQGCARAQYELGMLILEKKPFDSYRRIEKAAEQGYAKAQLALGAFCRDGRLIRTNYPEAYKWFSLAAMQQDRSAELDRDALILKMTSDQINEGRRRVAVLLAKQAALAAPPVPAIDLSQLALKGVTISHSRRLAIINNQTFRTGEERTVQAGDKRLKVRCVEIRGESVMITVEGSPELKELGMR